MTWRIQKTALCLALLTLQAGAATTLPRGIYTVKVAGKPEGSGQARTYLGIQLLPDTRYQGIVGSVDGNSFTFGDFATPADIAEPGREFYVHVLDGPGRGFIADISEFRADDILCTGALGDWMGPGTQILIRPHSTLGDIFGSDNRFDLGSGMDAASGDNVVLWDPVTQQERVYYFHTVRDRWEEEGIEADASQAIVRFPNGLYIVRRSPGNLRIALSGEIGSESVLLPVRPGANVFSLPINLSTSLANLIRTDGDHPVRPGVNANRADLLTLEGPGGNSRGPFYYLSRPGSEGWREVGINDSDEAIQPLDYLSTLVLRRNGPSTYLLAEGSLAAGPGFELSPDPEPGEVPLSGELPLPPALPPDISLAVETSTDLQSWSTAAVLIPEGNKAIFPLPPGQTRAFYRLNINLSP